MRRLNRARQTLIALAFLAPALVFFTVFLLAPAVSVLWWSTMSGGVVSETQFVGLNNWISLTSQAHVMTAIQNTLKFTVMVIPPIVILSLLVAMLLQRVSRGASIFRFLIYFPVLVPGIIAGLIWVFVTHPDFGLLNMVLGIFGLPPRAWLTMDTALPVVVALDVWRNVGYWAIFFLAALIGLPSELYEAAHLDGAGAWQRLIYVTIPLLRRILLLVIVIATIWALQVFDTVWALTQGGPGTATLTMVLYVFQYVFQYDQVGFAAAISVILLVIIIVLTAIQLRLVAPRRRS